MLVPSGKGILFKIHVKVFSSCLSMMILLDILKMMELRSTSFTKICLSPDLVLRELTPSEIFWSFALFLYNVVFLH